MALRELLKAQGLSGGMKGKHCLSAVPLSFCSSSFTDGVSPEENARAHEEWCNHLAARLLCVFVLDRFGDFVSDQVRHVNLLCATPSLKRFRL